jgi:hypothetical protein
MPRKRHTPEQIIRKLREAEVELAKGLTTVDVVRKLGITEQSYYRWRQEYNTFKPHSALSYRPPAPEAVQWPIQSTAGFSPQPRSGSHRTRTKPGGGSLSELYEARGEPAADARAVQLDPNNFNARVWPDVRDRAELPKIRYKGLGDTFASWLLTCGVQLGYVSVQLGHADVAVTARHYARWIGGADYRDLLVRRRGEVPADFLARLAETAPTALDGAGILRDAPDEERGTAQHPVGAKKIWRAQHDSNMRPSGPQPDALSN